jgi:hypothetical protein
MTMPREDGRIQSSSSRAGCDRIEMQVGGRAMAIMDRIRGSQVGPKQLIMVSTDVS